MSFWGQRRSIASLVAEREQSVRMKPSLRWPHLMALGVGAVVGAGILTLIGVGARLAGPGVLVSFLLAGVVSACAALCYAELAGMMPLAGGAFTYAHVSGGEGFAWLIGWSLVLEYTLVVATVAVSWSGYMAGFLAGLGVELPLWLAAGPGVPGGLINLPAIIIIVVVTAIMLVGLHESATINAALVVLKIVALLVFVAVAAPFFDAGNFSPFLPHGFGGPLSQTGVLAAASIIFFAFYGFDTIASAAEETIRPDRDIAIGIIGAMLVCVLLYIAVATTAIGAAPIERFAHSSAPLATLLTGLGRPLAASFLAATAVIALPTVVLAFLYGQSRVFLGMARAGLAPARLARLSPRGAPVAVTLFTCAITAGLAGLEPLDHLAALANAGTLAAFASVGFGLIVLRHRVPSQRRPFRAPLGALAGWVTMAGSVMFFFSLSHLTQITFVIWHALGLGFYAYISRRGAAGAAPSAVQDSVLSPESPV